MKRGDVEEIMKEAVAERMRRKQRRREKSNANREKTEVK